MRIRIRLRPAVLIAIALVANAFAETPATNAPRVDNRIGQIPQSAAGAPWAFIGFGIRTPASPQWFVAEGTPRGAALGRYLSTTDAHTAVLVLSSEILAAAVDSDAALLELTRARHGRIGERWTVQKHDETIVRHAGTRCASHEIVAREPEDRSPRKDGAKFNAQRATLFVRGLSCIHPTDPSVLVEIGVSERSRSDAMTASVREDVDAVIASLAFHRYTEQALQESAQAARSHGLAEAEQILKPFVDADAAWAGYFLAQIIERTSPPPENGAARLRALLEAAAERGLADAQWALGRLYLQGIPGLAKDPGRAEALLKRAAEHGHPAAEFQLGLSLLSGTDGLAANSREGALWIQRSAFRGQKEAQEMLAGAKVQPASPAPRSAAKEASKR